MKFAYCTVFVLIILLVLDGSINGTEQICEQFDKVSCNKCEKNVNNHLYSKGLCFFWKMGLIFLKKKYTCISALHSFNWFFFYFYRARCKSVHRCVGRDWRIFTLHSIGQLLQCRGKNTKTEYISSEFLFDFHSDSVWIGRNIGNAWRMAGREHGRHWRWIQN